MSVCFHIKKNVWLMFSSLIGHVCVVQCKTQAVWYIHPEFWGTGKMASMPQSSWCCCGHWAAESSVYSTLRIERQSSSQYELKWILRKAGRCLKFVSIYMRLVCFAHRNLVNLGWATAGFIHWKWLMILFLWSCSERKQACIFYIHMNTQKRIFYSRA